MADTLHYAPFFKGNFPSDAESRWKLIRSFINHWCCSSNAPLPEEYLGNSPLIEKAISICDGSLSYSIGQWLALVENAAVLDAPEIRDYPEVGPIEDRFEDPAITNATIILSSGEEDVFWSVANDRLTDDDPPVDIYQLYDESIPAFVGRNSSVSEFALKYLCLYNEHSVRNTVWFSAFGTDDDVRTVVDWFDYSLVFDSDDGLFAHFELLESNNIAAIVNGSRIEVSVFCDPATLDMPLLLKSRMEDRFGRS